MGRGPLETPPSTFTAYGRIVNEDGDGIAQVTLTFSGENGVAVTDENGNWVKQGLKGMVSVIPVSDTLNFSPVSLDVSKDAPEANFSGVVPAATSYEASGVVVDALGNGIEGVTIRFSGIADTVTTASDGGWQKAGLQGRVEITPELDGWAFSPVSQVVDITMAPIAFTAEQLFSIQLAIDQADDGDVIVVPAGTYYERIDFKGKNIVVQSTAPEDEKVVASTIIDGRSEGPAVSFVNQEPSTASLMGFTIRNGSSSGALWDGSGIQVAQGASPTISHNVITGNGSLCALWVGGTFSSTNPEITSNYIASNSGAGICIDGKAVLIRDNVIANNRAGIVTYNNVDVAIEGNIIEGNNEFGLVLNGYAKATIRDNTIKDQSIPGNGGGIHISMFSDVILQDNEIIGNTAQIGGGVWMSRHSTLRMEGNKFRSNTSLQSNGGAVWVSSTSQVLDLDGNPLDKPDTHNTYDGNWPDNIYYE